MSNILRNRAKCLRCGEIIESTHRHDFVRCTCGSIFVDGGKSYIRCGGGIEDIQLMTEYHDDDNSVKA